MFGNDYDSSGDPVGSCYIYHLPLILPFLERKKENEKEQEAKEFIENKIRDMALKENFHGLLKREGKNVSDVF